MKSTHTLAAVALMAQGCTSETEVDGVDVPCIGAFDDGDPRYAYSTNGWNVAMAVVFFELVIPPIVVIANKSKCPVRKVHP